MSIGRRDQLITLQTYTTTQDAYGEETQTWATAGQEWAAVFYGRGEERRQAAREQGSQTATFQVLDNAVTRAMTVAGRIVHDGANWDITGKASDTPKSGLIEFTAVRST